MFKKWVIQCNYLGRVLIGVKLLLNKSITDKSGDRIKEILRFVFRAKINLDRMFNRQLL